MLVTKIKKYGDKRATPIVKQPSAVETITQAARLLLICLMIPVLYIRVFK